MYPQSAVLSSTFVEANWDVPEPYYFPVVFDSNKLKDWADPRADMCVVCLTMTAYSHQHYTQCSG